MAQASHIFARYKGAIVTYAHTASFPAIKILFDLYRIINDWTTNSPTLAADIKQLLTDLGITLPMGATSANAGTHAYGSAKWYVLLMDAWTIYGDFMSGSPNLQADVQKFIADLGL